MHLKQEGTCIWTTISKTRLKSQDHKSCKSTSQTPTDQSCSSLGRQVATLKSRLQSASHISPSTRSTKPVRKATTLPGGVELLHYRQMIREATNHGAVQSSKQGKEGSCIIKQPAADRERRSSKQAFQLTWNRKSRFGR